MRLGLLGVLVALACYGASPVERMFDDKATIAQRNNACFDMRGQRNDFARAVFAKALRTASLRSCAATNLRVAGAVEELAVALKDEQPEVRAAAARELGSFERPELIANLAEAAAEPNLLVATNGMYALSQYRDRAVWPYLEKLASKGGMIGIMALDRIYDLKDPQALAIARKLLNNSDVPDRVSAMRVIGEAGDSSDLPALREIAARPEQVMVRQRGFGLMPAIDVAKAAKATIAQIEARERTF